MPTATYLCSVFSAIKPRTMLGIRIANYELTGFQNRSN